MKPSCFGRGTMVQTIGTSVTAGNQGWGWWGLHRMRTKPWGPWGYAHCHFHSRVNIQSPSDLQNATRKLDLGTSAETSWVLYTDVYSICQSMSQTLGSLNCPTSPPKSGGPRLLGRKILTFVKHHEKSSSFLVQCFLGPQLFDQWWDHRMATLADDEWIPDHENQHQNYTCLITEKSWNISNSTT